MKKILITTIIFTTFLTISLIPTYAATQESNSIQITSTESDKQINTIQEEIPQQTLEDGYYIIKSALDPNKVLDLYAASKKPETNIQLYSKSGGTNQIFEIKYNQQTGTYKIKSALSGKALDLQGAGTKNGTNVQTYTEHERKMATMENTKSR